jgi:hypothetical protein
VTDRKPTDRFVPQPAVFVLEIAGRPTLAFEATSAKEAKELLHERWLLDDLLKHRTNGLPLWDGKEKLRIGLASGEHVPEVKARLSQVRDQELPIVYLVPLDPAPADHRDEVATSI